MHYYKFNIGDYASHTQHLDINEDIAYRRMLDWCYLNESPLPESVEEIARLIRMREHCKCIASVLQEFFALENSAYHHGRVDDEVAAYHTMSESRKKAANTRWGNKHNGLSGDTSALQTVCKSNANHKPLTINHKPPNKESKGKTFTPPTQQQAGAYFLERGSGDALNESDKFIDFYASKNWMVGKNKMKDWKASVRNWMRKANEINKRINQPSVKQRIGDAIHGATANDW